jgi:hypothetical protein
MGNEGNLFRVTCSRFFKSPDPSAGRPAGSWFVGYSRSGGRKLNCHFSAHLKDDVDFGVVGWQLHWSVGSCVSFGLK